MSTLPPQVGGSHYMDCKIRPVSFIEANNLKFLEGSVVKRMCRHDKPTGKGRQDIEKAIHELQLLLELRYGLAKVEVKDGYMLCPYCGEVTPRGSIDCIQCKQAMPVPRYDEARMDVIGQNGNDGEHYEKDWVTHDGGPCPVPSGLKVDYKLRAGLKSDKPWPVEQLTWQYQGHEAPWEIVAYRLA